MVKIIQALAKAGLKAGKFIVTHMKAPAKKFLEHKVKGEAKKKGLSKFTKGLANKINVKDGDNPSLLDIGKQQLKNKLNNISEDWQDGTIQKKLMNKVKDRIHEKLSKRFNVDTKKLTEEHKFINKMRDAGIPLSDIMKLKQENKLNKDALLSYYKDYKKDFKSKRQKRNDESKLELENLQKSYNKEFENLYKKRKNPDNLKLDDLDLTGENRRIKDLNKKYKDEKESVSKYYDKKIKDAKSKEEREKLRDEKTEKLMILDNELNSKISEINSKKTAKETSNYLNNTFNKINENLLGFLSENNNLNREEKKLAAMTLLKSQSKLYDRLDNSISESLEENASFINENNLMNNQNFENLRDYLLNMRKEDLEKSGKDKDSFIRVLNDNTRLAIENLNKEAEFQKESTGNIIDFLEQMNKEHEDELKRDRDKEIRRSKADSEKNEAERMSSMGIMNVLKSQSTLFDLVSSNLKSPKEISKIFEDGFKAAVESLGEDIGFWGTGVALALKKIPEVIQMGFEKVIGFIFKPFDMIISKVAEPIGKGLTTAFGWAEPYQTPDWINTLMNIPVVKWLVKPLNYMMEKITNIPYNLKSFGEQLLETGESHIGEDLAHWASQPFVDITGGLSKLVLKILGLPDDMLDESSRQSDPSKQEYITTSSAAYVDKSENHDQAEKITSSNIDATASLVDVEDLGESTIEKGASKSSAAYSNIDEVNAILDEINKQKMLDSYNEEIKSGNILPENKNSLLNTDSKESESKAEIKELATLENYHEVLTEDQSSKLDKEVNSIIKQKMLDSYNEEIKNNNKAIIKEQRKLRKENKKNKNKNIKITDPDTELELPENTELIKSEIDILESENDLLNQIEIDSKSEGFIKEREINTKEDKKKEPDVIVQPTQYTYERIVHEYDAEPVFPTGHGF